MWLQQGNSKLLSSPAQWAFLIAVAVGHLPSCTLANPCFDPNDLSMTFEACCQDGQPGCMPNVVMVIFPAAVEEPLMFVVFICPGPLESNSGRIVVESVQISII
jgi:hypothetical protein